MWLHSLQWHALDRAEQQKYYDMARKEKELHLQLYPGWSARDNYATHTKKKKRKRDSVSDSKAVTKDSEETGGNDATSTTCFVFTELCWEGRL